MRQSTKVEIFKRDIIANTIWFNDNEFQLPVDMWSARKWTMILLFSHRFTAEKTVEGFPAATHHPVAFKRAKLL